jgi:hypothetical protein
MTEFLNVDLFLESAGGVGGLLEALGSRVVVLHASETAAAVELETPPSSADEAVVRFGELYLGLPPEARQAWSQCRVRRLDVGVQSDFEPHETNVILSPHALRHLISMDAELALTVYGYEAIRRVGPVRSE